MQDHQIAKDFEDVGVCVGGFAAGAVGGVGDAGVDQAVDVLLGWFHVGLEDLAAHLGEGVAEDLGVGGYGGAEVGFEEGD